MCEEIMHEDHCKLRLTLTGRLSTVYNVTPFIQGGVDIFISDHPLSKAWIKAYENHTKESFDGLYSIIKGKDGYVYSHQMNKSLRCIEYWGDTEQHVKSGIHKIISKLIHVCSENFKF